MHQVAVVVVVAERPSEREPARLVPWWWCARRRQWLIARSLAGRTTTGSGALSNLCILIDELASCSSYSASSGVFNPAVAVRSTSNRAVVHTSQRLHRSGSSGSCQCQLSWHCASCTAPNSPLLASSIQTTTAILLHVLLHGLSSWQRTGTTTWARIACMHGAEAQRPRGHTVAQRRIAGAKLLLAADDCTCNSCRRKGGRTCSGSLASRVRRIHDQTTDRES
jgi:hypothetical protein